MRIKILNLTFFISIFLVVGSYSLLFILRRFSDYNELYRGAMGLGYIYFYFLIPIILFSYLLIAVIFFKELSFSKSLKKLRVHTFSFIFFLSKYYENRIPIRFKNNTKEIIYNIELVGREGSLRLDSLISDSSMVRIFNGRDIIYDRRDDSINIIWLAYSYGEDEKIKQITGKWTYLFDELHLYFYDNDSIGIINYRKN